MAQYNRMVLTQDGLSLLAKGQTGVAIVYTRATIGDGYLPDGTALNTLTALVHETKSLEISSISASDPGLVTVRTSLSNQGLLVGTYVREVGLFATDPDIGEILYCVANADDLADYLPPEGTDVVEEVLNLNTIIGDAENVSAVISVSLVYATAQDLDDLRSETNSALDTKETPAGAQAKADAAAAIGVAAAGVVADDLTEHKAEDATQAQKGHVQIGSGLSVTGGVVSHLVTDGNKHIPAGGAVNQVVGYGGSPGTGAWVPAPTPVDYGRYQAAFGWDGATLVNCENTRAEA